MTVVAGSSGRAAGSVYRTGAREMVAVGGGWVGGGGGRYSVGGEYCWGGGGG